MNPWLPFQLLVLAVAWWLAGRAVYRACYLGSWGGADLARVVGWVVSSGRAAELPRLGEMLAPSAVATLLRAAPEAECEDDLVLAAQEVLATIRPEARLLRGMATIGTSLGLLAAIVTMRHALGLQGTGAMERAVIDAMDCAVVGFMTGFPCWTAIALARRRVRAAATELDRVVAAMARGAGREVPVDGGEGGK